MSHANNGAVMKARVDEDGNWQLQMIRPTTIAKVAKKRSKSRNGWRRSLRRSQRRLSRVGDSDESMAPRRSKTLNSASFRRRRSVSVGPEKRRQQQARRRKRTGRGRPPIPAASDQQPSPTNGTTTAPDVGQGELVGAETDDKEEMSVSLAGSSSPRSVGKDPLPERPKGRRARGPSANKRRGRSRERRGKRSLSRPVSVARAPRSPGPLSSSDSSSDDEIESLLVEISELQDANDMLRVNLSKSNEALAGITGRLEELELENASLREENKQLRSKPRRGLERQQSSRTLEVHMEHLEVKLARSVAQAESLQKELDSSREMYEKRIERLKNALTTSATSTSPRTRAGAASSAAISARRRSHTPRYPDAANTARRARGRAPRSPRDPSASPHSVSRRIKSPRQRRGSRTERERLSATMPGRRPRAREAPPGDAPKRATRTKDGSAIPRLQLETSKEIAATDLEPGTESRATTHQAGSQSTQQKRRTMLEKRRMRERKKRELAAAYELAKQDSLEDYQPGSPPRGTPKDGYENDDDWLAGGSD